MRRLAEDQILTWVASPERRPLVLRGARQTGKTWLVEHLARRIDEGPTAEQFVGQELRACRPFNQEPALFTWVRDARNSNAEVDYVLQVGSRIVPIEVKAGAAGRLRSLHMMVHEKDLDLAVRIGSGPVQLREVTTALPHLAPRAFRLLSVPFYLIGEIDRLVRDL